MRHLPRWLIFTAITVVLVLAALTSLTVVTVRESFPQTTGSVTLSALGRPVQVMRDSRGVPHIQAETAEDLFAAQGFVHAQDRFFQMDVSRHLASGRLAELFGESQVSSDAYVRTMGWRRIAEEEVPLLSARSRRFLEAYSAGVNSYMLSRNSSNDLSLEYTSLALMGMPAKPEPWTAADSLVWLKAMAWTMDGNLSGELESGVLSTTLNPDRLQLLKAPYDPTVFEPIVSGGAVNNGSFTPGVTAGLAREALPDAAQGLLESLADINTALPENLGSLTSGMVGSNAWVVNGDRAANGRPILATDSHLGTAIPSPYTQIGLHCAPISEACPYDVTGFSTAGLPGVISGHNGRIAWSFTAPNVDTQDLVIEEVDEARVRRGEDWGDVTMQTEQIRVAGSEPRTILVRRTENGPLLSDVDDQLQGLAPQREEDGTEYAVALRWTALTPSTSIDAIFGINEARDFEQFRAAAAHLQSPGQNLVFADVHGNIGYQLAGAVPVRGTGDGTMPVPGWDPAYAWTGLIPPAELPYDFNPRKGYIVAANQQIVADYPRVLSADASLGWRSQEVAEALNAAEAPLTVDSTRKIQGTNSVRYADSIVPALLRVTSTEAWVFDGQQVLAEWDRRSGPESAGAAYFHVVMKHVLQLALDDEIPEGLRTGSSDRWYGVIAELLRNPHDEFWDNVDTVIVEDRDFILNHALINARKEVTVLSGRDPGDWDWGKLHSLGLKHQMAPADSGPLHRLFNRGDIPIGGGIAVVEAFGYDDRVNYDVTEGPVMRMVVDLGDFDGSGWVNLSGQSGHAFHRHYDDQLPLLARNELIPWVFTPSRVRSSTVDQLELLPA